MYHTENFPPFVQQVGRANRLTFNDLCIVVGTTPRENTIRRLYCKGFKVAKTIEINGGKKTIMVKTIRAARKLNSGVEFYDKTFLVLLNSAGEVVYSNG